MKYLKPPLLLIGFLFLVSCKVPTLPEQKKEDPLFDVAINYDGHPIFHPTEVEVSWTEFVVDGFKEIMIERAKIVNNEKNWQHLASVTDSLAIAFTDTIDDDGSFQYRVRLIDKKNQFISAESNLFIVPNVTALEMPNHYGSLKLAYQSNFLDEGDSIKISPGTYAGNFKLLEKDVLIVSVEGPETTIFTGISDTMPVIEMSIGIFSGFTLTGGRSYNAGGIRAKGNVLIQNCIIQGNATIENEDANIQIYPFAYGGGVYLSENAIMENCLIKDNWSWFGAGGVLMDGNTIIRDCIVDQNRTKGLGGGILVYSGECILERVAIKRNRCLGQSMGGPADPSFGGGLGVKSGNVFVTNSILWKNNAMSGGGGFYNSLDGTLSMTNCTIVENTSGLLNHENGSGINNGSLDALNSIIWNNTGDNPRRLWQNAFYCNIDEIFIVNSNSGNIKENPEFTLETQDDFRLNESSPCIDIGHPDTQYNDQDGTRNDMGAFGGPGSY
ncbi:MAG: hypothetical protein ISR83_01790 [Candidatus Marinimicrobia bacterium]|nr:hypothetical protein [Candidatus Neomarinimicrobiota bacterium]